MPAALSLTSAILAANCAALSVAAATLSAICRLVAACCSTAAVIAAAISAIRPIGGADFLDDRRRVLGCRLDAGDLHADLFGRSGGLRRQRFDFLRDHGKAAPGPLLPPELLA
jgi:hypothetical protein